MKSVKAGYEFNIFADIQLKHIELKKTGSCVKVEGKVYPLFMGNSFRECQKVDEQLDKYGDKKIKDFICRHERNGEGR